MSRYDAIVDPKLSGLRVAGLFSGVGGIELGLQRAGHEVVALCENDPAARDVLAARFPGVPLMGDLREVKSLPSHEILAAGFPCQDLSQAGRTDGIAGAKSGLVVRMFELLGRMRKKPRWVVIENVPFMLHLDGGSAMRLLTTHLEGLGYRWAYRIVDSRAFGLPQRRRRVVLLAGREDPARVLLTDDSAPQVPLDSTGVACGFYWTEGNTGVGWAVDATPPLKGGSGLGIPSPPAVVLPDGLVGTPSIGDAERLQGFEAGWTASECNGGQKERGARWRLVGNAVSVPVAEWVGSNLNANHPVPRRAGPSESLERWPDAASGGRGARHVSRVGAWPATSPAPHLADFLHEPLRPLSARAASGFLFRAKRSRLSFAPGFLDAIESHIEAMEQTDGKGGADV